MRVTFVNKYYFPPHLGGVEQSLNLLATTLAQRSDMNVGAIVANESRATVREDVAGVDVLRVGRIAAAASTPFAPGMTHAIREAAGGPAPADIFHLQFPYPWGEISWMRARTGTPTVMTYHSDVVRQKRAMSLYAPVLRRVLERVDRIIVGAPQMIENSSFLAPVAEKCRVIPFAIDASRFAETPAVAARVEQLRSEVPGPITLFVGRLVYYKGVDVLVRAMPQVPGTLVVIGRGPLESELREAAMALGVSERIRWLAPVDDAELAAWYRAADVFVLPSVARTEAYGLVQLEAQTCGTPVVSTALPTGVPFVNRDGVTGLVVPPGDAPALAAALARLLGDDELRGRLGMAAKARAESEFSLASMVESTLDTYREAIESHARRGDREPR